MAKERAFLNRNVGTQESPVWEKWFAITVADAVMMSDNDGEAKNIQQYVIEKFNELVGGATTYTTLKEIEDWINAHEEEFTTLTETVNNKVDKVPGKGLSTNDYTNEDKEKLQNATNNSTYTNIDGINFNKYTATDTNAYAIVSRIDNTVMYALVYDNYKDVVNSIFETYNY